MKNPDVNGIPLSDIQKPAGSLKDNALSFVVDLNGVLVVDLGVRNGVQGF
jgi:hypothetical protein